MVMTKGSCKEGKKEGKRVRVDSGGGKGLLLFYILRRLSDIVTVCIAIPVV